MSKEKVVYQLKITLQGSKPPIWRRVLVASDTRLSIFHSIIQGAMGWYNCHLHQFIVGGVYYSMPYPGSDELNAKDSRKVKLSDIVSGERFTFRYEYDFGDGWMHAILVEKILPFVPGMNLPTCITGKRACPPEDVGGIWGYSDLLMALKDPDHPEHEAYQEWLGADFDPEVFDLVAVNQRLQRLK